MKNNKILIIQGGAVGSESKGLVAGEFCRWSNIDYAVRTGSINAGHSVYYKSKLFKMQQIPVGWVNLRTKLVIGAGAYVHPPTLEKEISMINEATGHEVRDRLFIDKRAGVHLDSHHEAEQKAKLHERMGSTGEGVAAAIVDKMARRFDYQLFSQTKECKDLNVTDTVSLLNKEYDKGKSILLEGTQGTLLDLHLGHYPFTTSRQTSASAWATEAGLSPALNYEVVLVVRTHPIRVAGNSGPLPKELLWEDFAEWLNKERVRFGFPPLVSPHALSKFRAMLARVAEEMELPNTQFNKWDIGMRQKYSEQLSNIHKLTFEEMEERDVQELKKLFEMTTVTKKLRRIAELDIDELKYAIAINRPAYLVLTFLNYRFPSVWGLNTWAEIVRSPQGNEILEYLKDIKKKTGVPVKFINTSPFNLIKTYEETI